MAKAIANNVDELVKTIASLNKRAREQLIGRLLDLEEFREDLVDAAIIESRRCEPLRPFRDYLKERGIKA